MVPVSILAEERERKEWISSRCHDRVSHNTALIGGTDSPYCASRSRVPFHQWCSALYALLQNQASQVRESRVESLNLRSRPIPNSYMYVFHNVAASSVQPGTGTEYQRVSGATRHRASSPLFPLLARSQQSCPWLSHRPLPIYSLSRTPMCSSLPETQAGQVRARAAWRPVPGPAVRTLVDCRDTACSTTVSAFAWAYVAAAMVACLRICVFACLQVSVASSSPSPLRGRRQESRVQSPMLLEANLGKTQVKPQAKNVYLTSISAPLSTLGSANMLNTLNNTLRTPWTGDHRSEADSYRRGSSPGACRIEMQTSPLG